MDKISYTGRVRNEKVFHRVKEERNILYTTDRRTANWTDHKFAQKLPSKTRDGRKVRRVDTKEGRMRKA
jgi:hypothetical protein